MMITSVEDDAFGNRRLKFFRLLDQTACITILLMCNIIFPHLIFHVGSNPLHTRVHCIMYQKIKWIKCFVNITS